MLEAYPLVKKITQWVADSDREKFRLGLYNKWQLCREYYEGKQWHLQGVSREYRKITFNICFAFVNAQVPVILANPPEVFVVAPQPDLDPDGESLEKALQACWNRHEAQYSIEEAVMDGLLTGQGIFKTFWDEKGNCPVLEVPSPETFHPDPQARSLENAEYVCLAYKRPPSYVAEKYGYQRDPAEPENQRPQSYPVIECWHERGARYTLIVGDRIKEDVENPYFDPSRGVTWPLAVWRNYAVPRRIWGISEIEQILDLQDQTNRHWTQLNANIELTAYPRQVTNDPSIRPASLRAAPGALVQVHMNHDIHWDSPNPLQAHVIQAMGGAVANAEKVLGTYEVLQGKRPGSILTGAGFAEAEAIALRRPMHKVRSLEMALEKIGSCQVYMMQQRYQGMTYMSSAEEVGYERNLLELTEAGRMARMRVDIQPGSTLGSSETARAERALRLAVIPAQDGKPMVDRQFVLTEIKARRAKEVIARMEQQQMLPEVLQAIAGQAAMAGGGAQAPDLSQMPTAQLMQMMAQGQNGGEE